MTVRNWLYTVLVGERPGGLVKPSHASRAFIASKQFTDREDARSVFQNAIVDAQRPDEYRILHWYGIGGQGKSALTREFVRIAKVGRILPEWKIACARVDFDDMRLRHKAEALLSIRLQIAETIGNRFAAFDTAFARYFLLTNPGVDIRKRHPELFRGENDLLNDLIDWSESPLGEIATEAVGLALPGLNLLYKYGSRLSRRAREWLDRRGKQILLGLDRLAPDEIADRLATFLGADICDILADDNKVRLVVIIDTHEALWRDHNVKDAYQAQRVDEWLRLLVQDSPGVLFAITGRDKLVWERIDADWATCIDAHLLGGLSDKDADAFLQEVPVGDPALRESIVRHCNGLPLYLDLQVSLYERIVNDHRMPTPEDFAGSFPVILSRFLDHLDEREQNVLRLASYPILLTEEMMTLLADRFLGGAGHLNWSNLLRFSFIEAQVDGAATMHDLMRQELQQREKHERIQLFASAHQALCDHYKGNCSVEYASQLTSAHESCFETAIQHAVAAELDEWCFFLEMVPQFDNAGRAAFAERMYRWAVELVEKGGIDPANPNLLWLRIAIVRLVGTQGRYTEAIREAKSLLAHYASLSSEDRQMLILRVILAQQVASQGHYTEAEREFRAIWDIQRRPDVLGEEHLETLVTRHEIAKLMASQGRYAEAEREFRAIWDIEHRPDMLGEEHPHTLVTRIEIARQVASQGRYAEAEREFRDIWNIERQPDRQGEAHSSTLRIRFLLAQVLDKLGHSGEATVLLDGMEAMLLRSVASTHRYVTELVSYLRDRKFDR